MASLVLNLPFPHNHSFGETIVSVFNIPIRSVNGLHYVGMISLALLIASLYFLTKSINNYHGRAVLLAIMVAIFAPSIIISSYQKTFATGIYAVSYERHLSNCEFNMIDDKTLHGECAVPLINYSNDEVRFTIEFYEEYFFEHDIQMVALMNTNGPYKVRLNGHESNTVKIETDIDVSNIENHVQQGSATGVNIIIKSGGKTRKL